MMHLPVQDGGIILFDSADVVQEHANAHDEISWAAANLDLDFLHGLLAGALQETSGVISYFSSVILMTLALA
jgi:hypothetical protein